jgi:hypothetical protein
MAINQTKLPKTVKRMLSLMSNQTSKTTFKKLMLEAEISNQLARSKRIVDVDTDNSKN